MEYEGATQSPYFFEVPLLSHPLSHIPPASRNGFYVSFQPSEPLYHPYATPQTGSADLLNEGPPINRYAPLRNTVEKPSTTNVEPASPFYCYEDSFDLGAGLPTTYEDVLLEQRALSFWYDRTNPYYTTHDDIAFPLNQRGSFKRPAEACGEEDWGGVYRDEADVSILQWMPPTHFSSLHRRHALPKGPYCDERAQFPTPRGAEDCKLSSDRKSRSKPEPSVSPSPKKEMKVVPQRLVFEQSPPLRKAHHSLDNCPPKEYSPSPIAPSPSPSIPVQERLSNEAPSAAALRSASRAVHCGKDLADDGSPQSHQIHDSNALGERKQKQALNDYDVIKIIGEGKYGKIYLAQVKATKAAVVLKCISKRMIVQQNIHAALLKEIELMRSAGEQAKHILRLYTYFLDEEQIYMVMEYAEGGSLVEHLRRRNVSQLSERHVRTIMQELLLGLSALHLQSIVHGGVRLENIFFRHGMVKLGDFSRASRSPSAAYGGQAFPSDFSRMRGFSPPVQHPHCSTASMALPPAPHSSLPFTHTDKSTREYLPPESIEEGKWSTKVDLWSAGVVMYKLLLGLSSVPPEFLRTIKSETKRQEVKAFLRSANMSPAASDFLSGLLSKHPDARWSAVEALQHPFITGLPSATEIEASSTCTAKTWGFTHQPSHRYTAPSDDFPPNHPSTLKEESFFEAYVPPAPPIIVTPESLSLAVKPASKGSSLDSLPTQKPITPATVSSLSPAALGVLSPLSSGPPFSKEVVDDSALSSSTLSHGLLSERRCFVSLPSFVSSSSSVRATTIDGGLSPDAGRTAPSDPSIPELVNTVPPSLLQTGKAPSSSSNSPSVGREDAIPSDFSHLLSQRERHSATDLDDSESSGFFEVSATTVDEELPNWTMNETSYAGSLVISLSSETSSTKGERSPPPDPYSFFHNVQQCGERSSSTEHTASYGISPSFPRTSRGSGSTELDFVLMNKAAVENGAIDSRVSGDEGSEGFFDAKEGERTKGSKALASPDFTGFEPESFPTQSGEESLSSKKHDIFQGDSESSLKFFNSFQKTSELQEALKKEGIESLVSLNNSQSAERNYAYSGYDSEGIDTTLRRRSSELPSRAFLNTFTNSSTSFKILKQTAGPGENYTDVTNTQKVRPFFVDDVE